MLPRHVEILGQSTLGPVALDDGGESPVSRFARYVSRLFCQAGLYSRDAKDNSAVWPDTSVRAARMILAAKARVHVA
jgi:hypothetical protein